jgi:hypothetical protein
MRAWLRAAHSKRRGRSTRSSRSVGLPTDPRQIVKTRTRRRHGAMLIQAGKRGLGCSPRRNGSLVNDRPVRRPSQILQPLHWSVVSTRPSTALRILAPCRAPHATAARAHEHVLAIPGDRHAPNRWESLIRLHDFSSGPIQLHHGPTVVFRHKHLAGRRNARA